MRQWCQEFLVSHHMPRLGIVSDTENQTFLVLEPEKWYPNLIEIQLLLRNHHYIHVRTTPTNHSSVELSELCNKYEQFMHILYNVEVAQLVEQSTFTLFVVQIPP